MDSVTGNQNTNTTGNSNPVTGNTQTGGQQEDYGDKAFDFAAKKSGHNVDRNTSEKITDGARGLFEKATGLVLP
jgi:hypothetical protein